MGTGSGAERLRRPKSAVARMVSGLVATGGLVLLVAACGGHSSSNGAGHPSTPSAANYAACMRSHGVPTFRDPSAAGVVPKADPQQLGVSSARLQTAQHACARLIPPSNSTAEQQQETQCSLAGHCSHAVVQQWMNGLLRLARCLRSNGEPNWPDPTISTQGLPHVPVGQAGIDDHSPQVLAKVQNCLRLTGFQGAPLP